MNQRGSVAIYLARLDTAPGEGGSVSFPDEAASALKLGARLLFFELRGEGDAAKGYVTGWGDVERISSEDGATTVQLRAYTPFKRRVPFSDLRADPRRDRSATIQQVNPDLFNSVLSKARR
jgi:hypothetical protein